MKIKGKVWKFGDNVNTDLIIPGKYLRTLDRSIWSKHVLEGVDPKFSSKISSGDIIVAGRNFGCGSSREQAALALKFAGIVGVVAESFGEIFFRNAINVGLIAVECPKILDHINEGEDVEVDLEKGCVIAPRGVLKIKPYPKFMVDIIETGGLIPYFKAKKKWSK
ncbi:MAG: 3-isopropylmalate dehydratase small subunit [Nitrososphaerales archaeon]